MKKFLISILLILALAVPVLAAPPAPVPPIRQADCSAVIGLGTLCYDTDDFKFYIGNGTSAVEVGFVASVGDITSVGDATSGAALDGTSDGGTYISLYDGNSNKTTIQAGNSTVDLSFTFPTAFPPNDGDMLVSGLTGTLGYLPQSTFSVAGHDHDAAYEPINFVTIAGPAQARTKTFVDADATIVEIAQTQIYDVDCIPISWAMDGGVAPGALTELSSTNKARYRDFSGAADNNVFIEWMVPYGIDTSGSVTFQIEGWVTNATAPANTETIKFALQGASIGHSELLSSALGGAVTVTFTADATLVQYDRVITGYSTAVTITGLAAGEIVIFNLKRDTTDTYAQAFGAGWLKIKYVKKLQGS